MKARWTEINAITPTTNKHRNHPTCIHITKLLHNDLWLFALFTALIQCIKNHSFVCKGQGLPRTHYSGVNVFVFMSLCVRVCVSVLLFTNAKRRRVVPPTHSTRHAGNVRVALKVITQHVIFLEKCKYKSAF